MGLRWWRRELSREAFAQEVLRAVLATGRATEASYDPDGFEIAFTAPGHAHDGKIYLGNTFREVQGLSPRERAARVDRLVAAVVGAVSPTASWDQMRARLRPVLRGVSFGAQTLDAAGAQAMVSRPALPFLRECAVVDQPTSMAYVTTRLLADWAVSADVVFAQARANLAATAATVPPAGGPTLLRFVDNGDGYFASMLLVGGFLAGLAPRVGGRPVAFVPDRDTLIVTADSPGLADVYAIVEAQYRDAPRAISPVGYTVDHAGAVVPYAAPADSPLAAVVHRAELLLAVDEYAGQKAALDARHARDGVDIFVASAIVAQRSDASAVSLAVWTRDVDTLLPRTDIVAFQDSREGSAPVLVPFDAVARECFLIAEPDYDPPRYRVTSWPDEAHLTRLHEQAVAL